MSGKLLELINDLRSSLDSIFEQFRKEGSSVGVQAQVDRWRTTARKKINQSLGEEESDTFNGLSLTVGFGAGLYDSQEDMTLDYIQRAAAYLEALENSARVDGTFESRAANSNTDPKRVFVVHGRNTALTRALYSFLRALKLTPFEWEEAVALIGGSPYVGDVVVEGMKRAQATVILLTPDESVSIRPELSNGEHDPDLTPQFQPRPNVIFEAGISLAIDEKRTIIVEVGKQRSFSDIFGRHLVRLDNTASRRNALAGRLKAAGCAVDNGGEHWLTEGDFDALPSSAPIASLSERIEVIELTDQENAIIKHLANNKRSVKRDLARVINESEVKLDYYLNRLQKKGFVGVIINMGGGPAQYMLYNDGTAYAVEKLGM